MLVEEVPQPIAALDGGRRMTFEIHAQPLVIVAGGNWM